jgi:hypothetical protein
MQSESQVPSKSLPAAQPISGTSDAKDCPRLKTVQTLSEWLVSTGQGASQIAHITRQSPSQVNRWLAGTEPVPEKHLWVLIQHVGDSWAYDDVLGLKHCENATRHIWVASQALAELLGVNASHLIQTVLDKAEELACLDAQLESRPLLQILPWYLNIGRWVLDLMRDVYLHGFAGKLGQVVSGYTVADHLRYPANRFLGLVLAVGLDVPVSGLEDGGAQFKTFRYLALNNLRVAMTNACRTPASKLARDHATHLLARHGDDTHKDGVLELVLHRSNPSDPLQVRLGFMGLMACSHDPEIRSRYRHQLDRSEVLAQIDLVFEAVHYGDANVSSSGNLPYDNRRYHRAILHLINNFCGRRVSEDDGEFELLRLVRLLDTQGQREFAHPTVLATLDRLMLDESGALGSASKRARDTFQGRFRSVLQWTERPSSTHDHQD